MNSTIQLKGHWKRMTKSDGRAERTLGIKEVGMETQAWLKQAERDGVLLLQIGSLASQETVQSHLQLVLGVRFDRLMINGRLIDVLLVQ